MLMAPLRAGRPTAEDSAADVGQILSAVRNHLGMAVGFVSEFADGRRIFRHVDADAAEPCIAVGGSDPLEESYCYWIARDKLPRLIRDPADHPFTARFPATKALPVGAHLSVPIRLQDGRVYGTFCCFSFTPDRTLTERDLATMEAFAEVASARIQQRLDAESDQRDRHARISEVLATRDIDIAFQPAVRLDRPGVEFVEALARFRQLPQRSPDLWFAEAADVGLGQALEMLAVELALEAMTGLPGDTTMSINVSPPTAISDEFLERIGRAPLERLILEVTEHDSVESYPSLLKALGPLRQRGLRLAVDDTGAGYSSFRHILHLRPDLIKLDMSLSRGIHRDPARRALASALISFAKDVGSALVAEGVETARELDSLRALGITIVQGFLLARPDTASRIGDALAGATADQTRSSAASLP